MRAIRITAPKLWLAGLLGLAALFHVQWLVACDLFPMADDRICCADSCSGEQHGRGDKPGGLACLTPWVKGAASFTLADRGNSIGDPPDDPPSAALADFGTWGVLTPRSPDIHRSRALPDGRSLYLTSSRLRL